MRSKQERALAMRLRAFPVFAMCTDDDLAELAHAGADVTLPAGWSVIHEQTPADACYVLLDGEIRIVAGRTEVARLGPGALVGEMALVQAGLRTASVVAATPVELLNIGYDVLERVFARRPRLRQAMLAAYEEHRQPSA